jgi:chemotaxis response regulator CheB
MQGLPASLPAAVFVVIHQPVESAGILAQILRQRTTLDVGIGTDGARLRHGRIVLAPPGGHMVIDRGVVRIEHSPREGYFRPAVDVLFRSAAMSYGRRVTGVVLSGSLNDGTAGLWQIKKHGGVALVQDPREAEFPTMPQSAIANVAIDFCLPTEAIAIKIVDLTRSPAIPPELSGNRSARVLIVEDERTVADKLEERLKDLGYEVAGTVGSGERAIESVNHTLPDVVLMDICLSGLMDGVEAAWRIWERFEIPVVYLTAYADERTLDAVKSTQNYGYVLKPVRPVELNAVIQLALARREHETSAPSG